MKIGHFSCGAASAVACVIGRPDRIVYADTGSEDDDNQRFMRECEARLFKVPVEVVRSDKYRDTWDVWESRNYIGDFAGAPCSKFLKRIPLAGAADEGNTVLIGYTVEEGRRAAALDELDPGRFAYPLIEAGLTKEACRALLDKWGVREPRSYALGFKHANCIPCCKAVSGDYWQRIRVEYPAAFDRYAALERRVGRTRGAAWWRGRYVHLDDLPVEAPRGPAAAPACDFLCQLAMR